MFNMHGNVNVGGHIYAYNHNNHRNFNEAFASNGAMSISGPLTINSKEEIAKVIEIIDVAERAMDVQATLSGDGYNTFYIVYVDEQEKDIMRDQLVYMLEDFDKKDHTDPEFDNE